MSLPAEGRAKRDGCDCPDFHVRCSHFAGEAIYLAPDRRVRGRWDVTRGKDGAPRWNGAPCIHTVVLLTTDYASALAAFYEAERRLLAEAELAQEARGYYHTASSAGTTESWTSRNFLNGGAS